MGVTRVAIKLQERESRATHTQFSRWLPAIAEGLPTTGRGLGISAASPSETDCAAPPLPEPGDLDDSNGPVHGRTVDAALDVVPSRSGRAVDHDGPALACRNRIELAAAVVELDRCVAADRLPRRGGNGVGEPLE